MAYQFDLPIHPAANLFPMMSGAELASLADKIKARGLLHPIVMYRGAILDGRNRYVACGLAGVDRRFEEYTGTDPISYALDCNASRRHLTPEQRAAAAAEAVKLYEAEGRAAEVIGGAKGGKVAGRGRPKVNSGGTVDRTTAIRNVAGRSTAKAAKHAGASVDSTAKMKRVMDSAPEVAAVVKEGKGSVADAVKTAALPAVARAAVVEAITSGAAPTLKAALAARPGADAQRDALGRVLPAEISPDYEVARARYDKAAGLATQLVGALGAIGESSDRNAPAAKRIREQVQLVGKEIRDLAPATVCPFCKLVPSLREGCEGCRGRGIVSERHFLSSDPMLQIAGAEAVVMMGEGDDRGPVRVSEIAA